MIEFDVESKDGQARAASMKVDGRECKTPVFMPVGTNAGVKTLIAEDLKGLGVEALITNMYHLLMKPGIEIIEEAGGLHEFMNWDGIIFTDSGGFQMIRKGFDQEMDSDGVLFKSDYDGSIYEITPEECIKLQERLGSDIQMCLDHCPPYPADEEELMDSLERTRRWAKKCKKVGGNVFGISQGGTVPELRKRSCQDLVDIGFEGYAIGGLSIGEPKEEMLEMLEIADEVYPDDRPRYLMGLGSPVELLEAVERGVDIFDSAYPTRNARHRTIFTYDGTIDIRKSRFKQDYGPLDDECNCPICNNYSRAYINHLCRADELAWMRMTTIHNLHFLIKLMRDTRKSIIDGKFQQFKTEFEERYE